MIQTHPWLRYCGKLPHSLRYPEVTLYEAVAATAARVPDGIAWDFPDTTSTYRELPKTRAGKIDHKLLVQEFVARHDNKEMK